MFFDTWFALLRVIVIGVLAYAAVIAIVRVGGKRTLSKMNAFDLVVTVALGSILATIILSKDVALIEGVLALALLALLQFAVAWASLRFGWVKRVAKAEARTLLRDGAIDEAALRRRTCDPPGNHGGGTRRWFRRTRGNRRRWCWRRTAA